MDVGLYPINLSLICVEMPQKIQASARIGRTQADTSCFMLFEFDNGAVTSLESSIEMKTPTVARILWLKR